MRCYVISVEPGALKIDSSQPAGRPLCSFRAAQVKLWVSLRRTQMCKIMSLKQEHKALSPAFAGPLGDGPTERMPAEGGIVGRRKLAGGGQDCLPARRSTALLRRTADRTVAINQSGAIYDAPYFIR